MPYRSDVDALAARHATLEAELADKLRARDEAARMLAEARACRGAAEIPHAVRRPRRRVRVVLALVATTLFALGLVLVARVDDQRAQRVHDYRMIRMLVELEAFTNQICACPDVACAREVNKAMSTWSAALAIDRESTEPDPQQVAKLTDLGQRIGQCTGKLVAASGSGER